MTTIYFPDLSHYQAGLVIQPGTPVVIAKATEGTSYLDGSYFDFKSQAAFVGAVFVGYHYLHAGNTAAQAQYAFNRMGKTPAMLDVESGSGGVADILGFVDAYRSLGGVLNLVYLPHWYWNQIGSPSLAGLTTRGIQLVSSYYTTYSDGGPGWFAYGGCTVAQWQYSDNQPYGGQHVDFNAYKGTKDQYAALVGAPVSGGSGVDPLLGEDVSMLYSLKAVNDHVTLVPPSCCNGHACYVSLSTDFTDAVVRPAFWYDGGWHVSPNVTVTAAGGEVTLPIIDAQNVRKVSLTLISGGQVEVSVNPAVQTI